MKRTIITFILILFFVLIGVGALRLVSPDIFNRLLLALNLTPNSTAEKARLDKISLLAISPEKKEIINSHTLFLGASPIMVELALGTPMSAERGEKTERWVYHFADDSRPTILVFNDNKLSSAYKVSASKLNLPPSASAAR